MVCFHQSPLKESTDTQSQKNHCISYCHLFFLARSESVDVEEICSHKEKEANDSVT